MTERTVRMLEVAAAAGVSRATVSLVMRDDPTIPTATRERVLQAARHLGYVYDRRAARLRSQRSMVVGMVITDSGNPFFAEFAEALEFALRKDGHDVVLGYTHDDTQRQRMILQRLVEDRVAGIVLVPAIGSDVSYLSEVGRATSLVLATRPLDIPVSYVGNDNNLGGYITASHLIEHGCRSLAFFGGLGGSSTRRSRAASFAKEAEARNIEIDEAWHIASAPDAVSAFELAKRVLAMNDAPDGVACNSDAIAYGLMRALADAGLRVGSDVRILGFDNLRYSALWQPSLSSVAVDPKVLGKWAAEEVLRVTAAPHVRIHRPELALRESCGCESVGSPFSQQQLGARPPSGDAG